MPYPIQSAQGSLTPALNLSEMKSLTIRALIIAALADGITELASIYIDHEIKSLIKALEQLGINFELNEAVNSCIVSGCNGQLPKTQASVWCGESSLIAHLLIAACAPSTGVYFLDAPTQLATSSLSKLLNILRLQGTQFIPSEQTCLPITLVR